MKVLVEGGDGRAALVVSHPGHELRVYGWLEQARPTVFVLTDGSGGSGPSRMENSLAVVERAGARRGAIFGNHTDRELYAALLAGDVEPFQVIAHTLHEALAGCTSVVADWSDGYNPLHDICRYMVDAVVRRRSARTDSFAFALVDRKEAIPPPGSPAFTVHLDAPTLERKRQAARDYGALEHEVAAALDAPSLGAESFHRSERVSTAVPRFYEAYGEQQVARARYGTVLRFDPHVARVLRALDDDDF